MTTPSLEQIVKHKYNKLLELNKDDYSELNIIDISNLLRFLFTDNGGNVQKLMKDIGYEILINTKENLLDINSNPTFFQQLGVNINGAQVAGVSFYNRVLSPEEIKSEYERTKNLIEKNIDIGIDEYLQQTCIFLEDIKIKNIDIIKFVSNKLGGVHYDEKREYLIKEKVIIEKKYIILDKIMLEYKILSENSVCLELLKISKDISNSKSLADFIKLL